MISARRHDYSVTIVDDDIDFMGHVNNATYLKWVQAAVIEHWHRIASPQAALSFQWIAIKHEITYRRPAFRGDSLVANVLLENVRRESAFYETVVRRGDEVIAEVKSRWCCVDAATGQPVRVTEEVVARFLPPGEPERPAPAARSETVPT